MRSLLFACAAACLLVAAPRAHAMTSQSTLTLSSAPSAFALQVPDKKIEITVGDQHSGRAWYRSPVWIAIGVLAFIVLILLVVMLSRTGGGGTTIIRE